MNGIQNISSYLHSMENINYIDVRDAEVKYNEALESVNKIPKTDGTIPERMEAREKANKACATFHDLRNAYNLNR